AGVGHAPCDRELSQCATEPIGYRAQSFHACQRRFVLDDPADPLVARAGGARASGYAVAILAAQQPACEWAPRRQSETDLFVQRGQLVLDAAPVEQVVLRLLHHRLAQVMPLGDLPRLADL